MLEKGKMKGDVNYREKIERQICVRMYVKSSVNSSKTNQKTSPNQAVATQSPTLFQCCCSFACVRPPDCDTLGLAGLMHDRVMMFKHLQS